MIDLLRDIEGRRSPARRPRSGLRWRSSPAPRDHAADRAAALRPGPAARLDSDRHRPAGTTTRPIRPPCSSRSSSTQARSAANIRAALRRQPQVGPADLVARTALTHGVAELVAYLSLRGDAFTVVYDEARTEQVSWTSRTGATGGHAAEGHVDPLASGPCDDRAAMTEPDLPSAVIHAHEGRRVPRHDERAWSTAPAAAPVRDYVEVLGLQVVVDEAEGYASSASGLPTRPRRAGAQADPAPRAVLHVSLLLALLRKRLAEFDARAVIAADAHPRPDRGDAPGLPADHEQRGPRHRPDRRAHRQGGASSASCARPRAPTSYEVRRILKAYVDAQWLSDFNGGCRVRRTAHVRRGRAGRVTVAQTTEQASSAASGWPASRCSTGAHSTTWSGAARRGSNTLVTGDIGSGKSTLVDAITTLLLPAHRISYNKAAGAETRERSLRSYVLGHYKSERNEATGSTGR